jgi:L-fuconolactonase
VSGRPRWHDLQDVSAVALREWLARTQEEAIDPEQSIIDPHHHLWDWLPRLELPKGTPDRSEAAAKVGYSALPLRYLGDDLIADIRGGGDNVVNTVFVECMTMYRADGEDTACVGETEFANGIAAIAASNLYGQNVRCCGAIVGFADLTLGAAVEPVLLAHQAASTRFRGIRHAYAWHESPDIGSAQHPPEDNAGLLARDDFRAGFAVLDRLGLTFDCWGYHTQLGEVEDLARAFPGVTMVVDHIGGPIAKGPLAGERDGTVFFEWQRGIRSLADCPNVVMKLGGCGMPAYGWGYSERDAPPSSTEMAAAWQPYFAELIEAFGVERCMFESNFPIDKVSCSYTNLWNAFKRVTTALGLSATEKNELFHDCAARVYKIGLGDKGA